MYIDGSFDKTIPGSGGNIGNAAVGINIGYRNSGGTPSGYFNGLIDDFRLYNYARTAAQVMEDYNAGATHYGAQTGEKDPWGGALPVAHWKMDENTGVLARDASENSYDGTIYGTSWTQGKLGPALSFGGSVSDYIDINYGAIDGLTDFTICFWMKSTGTGDGIISGAKSAQDNELYIAYQQDLDGRVHDTNIYFGNVLNDGDWYHVSIVRTSST